VVFKQTAHNGPVVATQQGIPVQCCAGIGKPAHRGLTDTTEIIISSPYQLNKLLGELINIK